MGGSADVVCGFYDHTVQMAALIDKMWAIPAKTELGRSAKVSVLLACILDWRNPDEEMDWRELMALIAAEQAAQQSLLVCAQMPA